MSFLDETIYCPASALLDVLARLIAAQENPCGALLLGHVERRPGLGWVVGGADAGLPGWTTEAIRALVGGHAILDGPMPAAIPILDVSVHAGFTGQRNVFLLLPASASRSGRGGVELPVREEVVAPRTPFARERLHSEPRVRSASDYQADLIASIEAGITDADADDVLDLEEVEAWLAARRQAATPEESR